MDVSNVMSKSVSNATVYNENPHSEMNGDGSEGEADEKWTHVGRPGSGRQNNKKKRQLMPLVHTTNVQPSNQANNRSSFSAPKDVVAQSRTNQLVRNRNSFPDTNHVQNCSVSNQIPAKQSTQLSGPNSIVSSSSQASSLHDLHNTVPDVSRDKSDRPHNRYNRTTKQYTNDSTPTTHSPSHSLQPSYSKPLGPTQRILNPHSLSNTAHSAPYPADEYWRPPRRSHNSTFGMRRGGYIQRFNGPRLYGNQPMRFRPPVSGPMAERRVSSPALLKPETAIQHPTTQPTHCTLNDCANPEIILNESPLTTTKSTIPPNNKLQQQNGQASSPCIDLPESIVDFLMKQWTEFRLQV